MSDRPLRLLYVGPFNSPHLEDLAIAMRERGHDVFAGGEVWAGGLPPSSLPAHGVPTEEMKKPVILWMRRLFRAVQPDVVHTHWMPFGALAALADARPFIATAWGSDVYGVGPKQRLLIRLALRRADLAMSDSAALVSELRKLGPSSLETMLVNWGVDLRTFRPLTPAERTERKRRLGLEDAPVVFSPRGIKQIYNPDVVVDAFKRVREAVPAAQLVLKHAGAEELPPEWSAAEGIHPVGRVEHEKMIELFQVADVTVSVPASDSSPRSVWEAMAAGSATVVSDLPWVGDLIANERDALVVPANPEAVAAAIVRLLRDDELRQQVAAAGRALVEQHRDREQELARVEACYRQLAGRR